MSTPIEIKRLGVENTSLARETIRIIKRPNEASEEPPSDADNLCAWLSEPSNVLIVATSEGVPAGFALGYLLDRVDEARTMLFFYEIEVAAACRWRGIGSRLVEAMKSVAHEQGVLKMWVQTDPHNVAARTLYQSTGGAECEEPNLLYVWASQALGDRREPASEENFPQR